MKFQNIRQYESKLFITVGLAVTVGFLLGILKSLKFIIANQYLGQGMYYLIAYSFTSIINKYLLIAAIAGGLILIVLILIQSFINFVGIDRKYGNLIIYGIAPAFFLFVIVGYFINKLYLPGIYGLKSIIGNTIWFVICLSLGFLILRISRSTARLKRYSSGILIAMLCLVIGLNMGRYLYGQSLESERPNLILISIDTLRADHLGCYGYNRNTSPNIDRFAEDGVLFANTIAQSSWTLPSHMSMLTGLYQSTHGVLHKYRRLSDARLTLGEILQNAGYETAAITDGGYMNEEYGYQGFSLYDDTPIEPYGNIESTYMKAIDWLKETHSRPFFLFLHTYQVHAPYHPPMAYDLYSDKNYRGILEETDKKRPVHYHSIQDKMKHEDFLFLIDKYDGDIYYTDHFLGKLFEELKGLGLYDDSIIILTSDHGENFLDHKAYKIGHIELYDVVIKVPLIIKAPAFPKNRIIEAQVESLDIMPTVLDLLEIPNPIRIDGESLLGLVKNGSYEQVFAFSERNRDYKIIRSKDWKLLHRPESKLELYDLIKDPKEQDNLFEQKAEVARPLFDALNIWADAQKQQSELSSADNRIKLDEELTEQLKALGYIN